LGRLRDARTGPFFLARPGPQSRAHFRAFRACCGRFFFYAPVIRE
jgi:hypothetical protein